jgi:hypothetical protein
MKAGSNFKLAQTGGSSGSIIPPSLQDTPMDFESFKKAGVSLGSGALLICDERTCVVDLALTLMKFFRFESCGKCTPCRVGTERAVRILTSISEGQAQLSDLDTLLKLADEMELASNCGLGQTAAVPIRDTLKNFRAEVEAHIRLGVCPAGVCAMAPEAELELMVSSLEAASPPTHLRSPVTICETRRMNSMIQLTINGKQIEAPEGVTVLAAAKRPGSISRPCAPRRN